MHDFLSSRFLRVLVLSLFGMGSFALTLGWLSRQRVPDYLPTRGLQLRPCPDRPNCVVSTSGEAQARVDPLWRASPGAQSPPWEQAVAAVISLGGAIQQQRQGYLWAVFTSRIAGFADDVEILADPDGNWQVRSASRLGYSDLNLNRQRVAALSQLIHAQSASMQ